MERRSVSFAAGVVSSLLGAGALWLFKKHRPGVSQSGSLKKGCLYVDVLLECGPSQCQASLLIDTGCNWELNLSEYTADLLGLAPDGAKSNGKMGQGHTGQLACRGSVRTTLLLEGEEEAVLLKDPWRSGYLTVWTDVGTSSGSSSSSSAASSARANSTDEAAGRPPLKIHVLSPIYEGQDKHGYDAVLGAHGLAKLNLGIDRETMRLYGKQTPGHFRNPSKRMVRNVPQGQQQEQQTPGHFRNPSKRMVHNVPQGQQQEQQKQEQQQQRQE